MSDTFLTLLELAKRTGSDADIGLIEEVTTHAPEVDVLMGRVIKGTTYKYTARNTLPSGPAFRNANEGSDIVSSKYEQKVGQAFFLDGQMQVDEAIVKADDGELSDLLADEAVGVTRTKMINLGTQIYEGKSADTKGFFGFKAFVDTTNMVVDATGTGSSSSSAWLVYNDIQGVHLVFGNGAAPTLGQWTRQQVQDSNSKKFFAYVNNLAGWIGLACNHTKSLGRIKNLTSAKPLTDHLGAQMLSKLPIGMRVPGKLRWFINRDAAYWLQLSRSTILSSGIPNNTTGQIMQMAPTPTEMGGVPITITDSITTTETAA